MYKEAYRKISFTVKMSIGLIMLICTFVVAISSGAAKVPISEVWSILLTDADIAATSIIQEIRLPRELAAIFVGAGLSVSGAIMQGVTRNPLADPGLLGLSAGASAALAITLAIAPNANYFSIMIACFIGAAIGATMVFGVGLAKKGGHTPFRIVLAGAAISALLYAIAEGVGIYFKVSKSMSMWTSGGLSGTAWGQLKIIIPFIILGLIIAQMLSRQLTILSLDEEVAVGLGQKTLQIKFILFCIMTLLAGASVALVGNIVFIGLMVPHIVRAIVGSDYRFIIPMSAIVGAIFMLLADTLGRTIHAPYETPVAAIVALMGLPFFLVIIRKGGKAIS